MLCAEIVPWLFLVKTSVRRARSASKAVCTTALNFTPIVPRTRCKSWSEYRTLRGRVWGTLSAVSVVRSTEQRNAERTSERFWMRKYADSKIHRLDRWIVQTVAVVLPARTPARQVMNEICQPHNDERNANTEKRFSIAAAATSSCGSNPRLLQHPKDHLSPSINFRVLVVQFADRTLPCHPWVIFCYTSRSKQKVPPLIAPSPSAAV